MKAIIDRRSYDTDQCEILAESRSFNSHYGYTEVRRLLRTSRGELLTWVERTDQYLHKEHLASSYLLSGFDLTPEQEARCIELQLLKP